MRDVKRWNKVVELAIAMLSSTDARRCRTLEWESENQTTRMGAVYYLEVHLLRSRVWVYPSQDPFSIFQSFPANHNPSWGRNICRSLARLNLS